MTAPCRAAGTESMEGGRGEGASDDSEGFSTVAAATAARRRLVTA